MKKGLKNIYWKLFERPTYKIVYHPYTYWKYTNSNGYAIQIKRGLLGLWKWYDGYPDRETYSFDSCISFVKERAKYMNGSYAISKEIKISNIT